MKLREYYVYRYRYVEMEKPAIGAQAADHIHAWDTIPCTVLSQPGIVLIEAQTKEEAVKIFKSRYQL